MPNQAASELFPMPYDEAAITLLCRSLRESVGGRVTLGFVFVSPDYRDVLADFLEVVRVHGHVQTLVGCSLQGLVADAVEAEGQTGCAFLFLNLPESAVRVEPIELSRPLSEGPGRIDPGIPRASILLADPSAPDLEAWIRDSGRACPGRPIVGALTSGGADATGGRIFHQQSVVGGAGIAVGIEGGLRVVPVVSHACRPIGFPLTITGAADHFVRSLGNRSAYEVLSDTYNELPDADKAISRGNLFAGLAASEYLDDFGQGDFLIRNILSADPNTGTIVITGQPRIGQTLQFQLRDPRAARADLRRRCVELRARRARPFASLLFTCAGRGEGFFGEKGCDAGALAEGFGPHPCAGGFCLGEIGPASSGTFVHGYTASAALFCDLYEGAIPRG
jgi:small ligand-binding sensory domain FIST